MNKIKIGCRDENINYDFRETCFGICYIDGMFYLTQKKGEIYLAGGGIEKGENHIECLKREFLEEIGCNIENISELCTIDCFWITRNNKHMESLTHIYNVNISEKVEKPSEVESNLIKLNQNEAKKALELPYQKKALEIFINNLNS